MLSKTAISNSLDSIKESFIHLNKEYENCVKLFYILKTLNRLNVYFFNHFATDVVEPLFGDYATAA